LPTPENANPISSRYLWRGATRLVVRPAAIAEVAAVVRICAEARLTIVPQGGNTGLLKRDEITHYKSPVEIELMHTIKRALDPDNIMNPGKVVSV
jgi:FAD/FMN-containing dehydrogenase